MASSINWDKDASLSTLRCFSFFRRSLSTLVANIFFSAMLNTYQKKTHAANKKFEHVKCKIYIIINNQTINFVISHPPNHRTMKTKPVNKALEGIHGSVRSWTVPVDRGNPSGVFF